MRAMLFDFDGTLADTAPDLAGAVNRMREERGLAALPLAELRPHASSGARGLLRAGFGMQPQDDGYEPMRDAFLAYYSEALCVQTRLFPGVAELLAGLEARGLPWGIVTNKATRFTHPIVEHLGLSQRAACVVCGDTTPHPKPHPAPLLHAAQHMRLEPQTCAYVGDDLRDIQAARAAGMLSYAVDYGYSGIDHGGPHAWNADAVISHPMELLSRL
jgi:2-phosphoglycolate phosphatase